MEYKPLSEFGVLLLFFLSGVVFVLGGLITAWLIRPHRPNYEKLTTYECGEEPTGIAWGQFNVRFYIIALVFILFDVEIVFLFPWATVFGSEVLIAGTGGLWGWFSLVEMFVFVAILALGLAYVWAKGLLDWVKPKYIQPQSPSKIPVSIYEKYNQKGFQGKKTGG